MSRRTWDLIKHAKRFYVSVYRWLGSALIFSVAINFCLGLMIYYIFFNLPDRDYYATYGETPPVLLTSMSEPNYSSLPLLASETNNDSDIRAVPN